MLHMFQAVPPPIIRIPKLYTQHRVFVELFLLLTICMSELELTQKRKPRPTFWVNVRLWPHSDIGTWDTFSWNQKMFRV